MTTTPTTEPVTREEPIIRRPEKNRLLIRQIRNAYWEATGQRWYPDKRVVQYILCEINKEYAIRKRRP